MAEGTVGREPIAIVEIDQTLCNLTYGEAPCTAALGTTGDNKCYNTFKSCQDPDNFDPGTLTLRFVTGRQNLPRDLGTLVPCLRDLSTSPGTVRIDEGLGKRASVDVQMQDFPFHDRLVDKYATERVSGAAQASGTGYDPAERGTFWTKWLQRNPYHQGYPLRIREGYVGQSLSSMRVRHYVIDRIDGPDAAGNVRITAKDVLKLADGDRSQIPEPSEGRLDTAITDTDTSATLVPSGIGDDEYPSSGLARIGDELVAFSRSGDTLTLDTRGARGSEADSHDADDSVQLCYTMDDVTVSDALYDILTTYAPVDTAWVPKSDWDNEVTTWLIGFNLTGEITEPTGVDEVVKTILKQTLCFMWWDEYAQLIKLSAIKPPQTESSVTALNDDQHFVADSVTVKRKPEDRRSRVYIYYDILDPTEDRDEPSNYRKLRGRIDADAESDNEYGETRVQSLFAPFWTGANTGATLSLGSRKLARLRDIPVYLEFALDAKDRDLGMADVIDVTHRNLVDLTGAKKTERYQIVERNETEPGHLVRYKAQQYTFLGRYAFITENSYPDYGSATAAQRDGGGFICEDDGTMTNGDDPYKII
mgnify:CR=1 FL=1